MDIEIHGGGSLRKPIHRGRPARFPIVKQRIRSAILQGELKPEQQLAAFPKVARQYGVGSLTAKRAIDDLVKEGWLETKRGVGTFVKSRQSLAPIVLTAPSDTLLSDLFTAEVLDEFHHANPSVRILRSKEPNTDIFATSTYTFVVDCIRTKKWLSLDKLHHEFGGPAWELPSAVRRSGEWQGQLYGLPLQMDLAIFQANPGVLRSFGLDAPDHYLDWEMYVEILQRCRADRDGDGATECCGSFCDLSSHEWMIPFWQNGGRLDDREAFFGGKAFDAIDKLWRLIHVERTLPMEMPIGEGEMFNRHIRRRFDDGKLAVRKVNTRELFHESPFPTQVLLPRFGAMQKHYCEGLLLGINRDCTHPEVAYRFLQFCYRRFVEDNPEFPFGLKESDRRMLRQRSDVKQLLMEAFEGSVESLHEGVPERTWSIEKEIYQWFHLFQNRTTTMARLEECWNHWK